METPSIVDVLIQNITQDQALLKDADKQITEAKTAKGAAPKTLINVESFTCDQEVAGTFLDT